MAESEMTHHPRASEPTKGPWIWDDRLQILAGPDEVVFDLAWCGMRCDKKNARLIAAAPELLAALIRQNGRVEDWHDMTVQNAWGTCTKLAVDCDCEDAQVIAKARALIAEVEK
jgi:hypothetical protein